MNSRLIKVAVIAGGDSSEREVSLRSGQQVFNSLDTTRFQPFMVELASGEMVCGGERVDLTNFSTPSLGKFDYALIIIHGTPGENGILQGYFEFVGVPYSTSNTLVSALTFDKELCKLALQSTPEITLAKQVIVRKGERFDAQDIAEELGLPLFVKPNASGSSFGVSKVKCVEDIAKAVEMAMSESESVMCEEYIEGTEISQGVMTIGGEVVTLPITELVSLNEFFDYEAKYTAGKSSEITPARLTSEVAEQVSAATKAAYQRLGCRGVVRIDYIVKQGVPYFIEVNSVPGMSAASIVPQQWAEMGLTMQQGWSYVIESTL